MKIGSVDNRMNKINKVVFIFQELKYIIFGFILFSIVLVSCQNDNQEISRVGNLDKLPAETIVNLETLYSDSGLVKVKVKAPLLQKILKPEPITELPKGIKIEFFDDHFNVISQLTANYAVHLENKKQWIAKSNVVVVNEKNEKLNTEKLVWDEGKELLSSDEFVKISTKDEIIYGEGFEANQDFSKYKIFKVKGRITVNQ